MADLHRLDASADRAFLREGRTDPYTGVAFRPTNTVVVAGDGTVLLRETWDALDGAWHGSTETIPWSRRAARGDGAATRRPTVVPTATPTRGPAPPPPPPQKKRRWWVPALAALVVAGVAIGGVWLAGTMRADEEPVVVEAPAEEPALAAPTLIRVGTVDGELGEGDARGTSGRYEDRFTFAADSSGKILSFVVEAEGFLPDLLVTAPDGRRLDGEALDEDGRRVAVRNVAGPGRYEVLVTSREPLGEGAYTLTTRAETPEVTIAADGRTITARLGERSSFDQGFYRDTYRFRAEKDREYTLQIASAAFRAAPTLTSGGRPAQAERRRDGDAVTLRFKPAADATYRLVVTSEGSNQRGQYTLRLAAGPKPQAPAPAVTPSRSGGPLAANGAPARDSLGTGATRTYTFAGRVGDRVRLDARATGFAPRLVLIGPDGRRVAADPDGDRASLRETLTADGTYRVQVGSGEGSGLYQVSLESRAAERAADIPRLPGADRPRPTPPPAPAPEPAPPPAEGEGGSGDDGGEEYQPTPIGDGDAPSDGR